MIKSVVTLKNSIFIRLLITFLLVVVPIYFLSINIVNWNRNTLSEEILSSMEYQSSFYLNTLDNDIQRIKDLQFDCNNDNDMNSLANSAKLMSVYERTKVTNRIQQRLTAIKNSSAYIKDVSVHILSIERTINSLGSGIGSIYEFSESGFSLSDYIDVNMNYPIAYKNNRLILTAVFPNMNFNNKKPPSFIIDVELSKDALEDALARFESHKGSGSLLANLNNDFFIASSDEVKASGYLQELIKDYKKNKQNNAVSVEINGNRYLMIYVSSDYSGLTLSRYLPEDEVFKSMNQFKLWFWALSLLGVVIIVIYSISSYKVIHKPLHELVKSFKKVENGDFNIKIEHAKKDEFGYLYRRFNEMVKNLKALIEQVYKQKILAQKAELKQLQSQINPHFWYNSYFLLHRMIKREDMGNAVCFSKLMGTYFQFITRSGEDKVALSKEVEHARIYTEIQAMRFEERIQVEFCSLPEELSEIPVPRLILQPVIENAFEHGLENKQENGFLKVWFKKNDGGFAIFVEDNGEDLNNQELTVLRNNLQNSETVKENTGIININRRIHLMCGDGSGVAVSRGNTGGLRVCISINVDMNTKEGENE